MEAAGGHGGVKEWPASCQGFIHCGYESLHFPEISDTPLECISGPTIAAQKDYSWGSREELGCLCIEAWKITSSKT